MTREEFIQRATLALVARLPPETMDKEARSAALDIAVTRAVHVASRVDAIAPFCKPMMTVR